MCNEVISFMEAKCVTDQVKPPEEIGLTLPHKIFAVLNISEMLLNRKEEMRQQLRTSAAMQW